MRMRNLFVFLMAVALLNVAGCRSSHLLVEEPYDSQVFVNPNVNFSVYTHVKDQQQIQAWVDGAWKTIGYVRYNSSTATDYPQDTWLETLPVYQLQATLNPFIESGSTTVMLRVNVNNLHFSTFNHDNGMSCMLSNTNLSMSDAYAACMSPPHDTVTLTLNYPNHCGNGVLDHPDEQCDCDSNDNCDPVRDTQQENNDDWWDGHFCHTDCQFVPN